MEIHKVTLYIVDTDEIGAKEVESVLENTRYPNRCITPEVSTIISKDIGEWDDDCIYNNPLTCEQAYIDLFREDDND